MLNTISFPAETPNGLPPLLIAHGLFGSARNWGVIARRLAADRDVITVDLRNHGDSPRAARHRYPDLAADLAEVIAAGPGQADVLGHSMGGKAAMMLALTDPERVGRLVVADIAPVAYAHDQQRHIAAMRGVDLTGITLRSEADAQLAPLLPDEALRAFFLQSLDLKASPPRWKLNLDALEAEMAHIVGWPGAEGSFPRPALFLTGASSPYVLPAHHALIRTLFPAASFVALPGAGHWLHAEQPRPFEEAVRAFLG